MSILKVAGKLLQGGASLLGSEKKTQEEVESELSTLDPKSQYNRTMARPRIALGLVYTLILGVIIRWIQQIFGIHEAYLIDIPDYLISFSKIIVTAYIGSRGIEKVTDFIMGKVKK